MLIFCYTDIASNTDMFETVSAAYNDKTLSDWCLNHPNVNLKYVFDSSDELMRQDIEQKNKFTNVCRDYGLEPSDYGAVFRDPHSGDVYQVIGVRPSNTKYKCLLKNISRGMVIKATPGFVRNGVEKGRIS